MVTIIPVTAVVTRAKEWIMKTIALIVEECMVAMKAVAEVLMKTKDAAMADVPADLPIAAVQAAGQDSAPPEKTATKDPVTEVQAAAVLPAIAAAVADHPLPAAGHLAAKAVQMVHQAHPVTEENHPDHHQKKAVLPKVKHHPDKIYG